MLPILVAISAPAPWYRTATSPNCHRPAANLSPQRNSVRACSAVTNFAQALLGDSMTVLARANQLELRLSRDPAEIHAAQQLRYRVFYEEMGAMSDRGHARPAGSTPTRSMPSPIIWSWSIWSADPSGSPASSAAIGSARERGPPRWRLLYGARVRPWATSAVSAARSWNSAAPASSRSTAPVRSCSCSGAASPTISTLTASA